MCVEPDCEGIAKARLEVVRNRFTPEVTMVNATRVIATILMLICAWWIAH